MTESLSTAVESTAQIIGEHIDRMFDSLTAMQPLVLDLTGSAGPVYRKTLTALREPLGELIHAHAGLVDGAGLAVAPGLLADADLWLQWWRRGSDGGLHFKEHTFNPDSVNFYDYTALDWFNIPAATGEPVLVGPYVDSGGTDLRVITAALAVAHNQNLCSVLAADLSLDFLEVLFLRSLRRREQHVALVTGTGKVVVSNTARHATGTLLTPNALAQAAPSLSCIVPVSRIPAGPWRLVVLP